MRGRVVITGGRGALGRSLDHEFAAAWHVEAPGRPTLDVSDPDSVRSFFSGRVVDLLICAAGITRDSILPRLGENDWDTVMAVNLRGPVACARAALPGMLERGRGHIIFISSFSALHPPLGQVAYAASKSALIGMAGSLAAEVGRSGIRVNTILPGFMETAMTAGVSPRRLEEVRLDHVLGRYNTPEQVSRFIRFLEEQMPHTSGQVFQLDSRLA